MAWGLRGRSWQEPHGCCREDLSGHCPSCPVPSGAWPLPTIPGGWAPFIRSTDRAQFQLTLSMGAPGVAEGWWHRSGLRPHPTHASWGSCRPLTQPPSLSFSIRGLGTLPVCEGRVEAGEEIYAGWGCSGGFRVFWCPNLGTWLPGSDSKVQLQRTPARLLRGFECSCPWRPPFLCLGRKEPA